ncbi:MAG: hypothetical protein H0V79_08010 [Actinobacteria bacterium]|nr:hypothetical protein [Actinomycetota bacterium]
MRYLITAVLLATLSLGCSGDNGDEKATISERELSKLVLQPGDLPRVFTRFDEGRQLTADQPGGARSKPDRFGREEGWKSRYRRQGSSATRGPLVTESRVDLFESGDGAKDELAAVGDGLKELDKPSLGDEARALTLQQGAGGGGVRYYLIAWREDNVTASVFVNGFEGKMTLEDALALARKQQQRIAKAAGSPP